MTGVTCLFRKIKWKLYEFNTKMINVQPERNKFHNRNARIFPVRNQLWRAYKHCP